MYSTVSILAPSKSLSPVNAAIGLRVGLSFIPELVAVILLIVGGIITRDVRKTALRSEGREVEVGMERLAGERGKYQGVAGREFVVV